MEGRASDGEESSEKGEEEEEEEKEEQEYDGYKPKYDFSFDRFKDGKSDSDKYEKSWDKFGYGLKSRSDDDAEEDESYESSESNTQPQRVKFHHEKMEMITTPLKKAPKFSNEELEPVQENNSSSDSNESDEVTLRNIPVKAKVMSRISGNLNHTKPRKAVEPIKVKSQQPKSDAGKDDLKYFQ